MRARRLRLAILAVLASLMLYGWASQAAAVEEVEGRRATGAIMPAANTVIQRPISCPA